MAPPSSTACKTGSLLTAAAVTAALAAIPARAQDATWSTNPIAGNDFNTPANWTPAQVPTGVAFFGATSPDGLSPLIFSNATLSSFQFLAGAPSYSIGVLSGATLDFVGGGVTNDSSSQQVIVVLSGGTLRFDDNSTAGNGTIGYGNRGGTIVFDNSAAGSARFENQNNGTITFIDSDAGRSEIANNVGAATVIFEGTSSADSAAISNTTTGGGSIIFTDTGNAGGATIQNFGANNTITFQGSSNAGSAAIENNSASDTLNFTANSTAGASTITNNGTTTFSGVATGGQATIENAGTLNFTALSQAGASTITNNATTAFSGVATAGRANIENNATLNFSGASNGGVATITTNSGGVTSFLNSSTGLVARFITNAGGTFDMSSLTSGGTTAGSIEGAGSYILGANELTTGLNNLSTTVSGVVSGAGGSLVKVGDGTLTLNGIDPYTGGTTVSSGTLAVGDPAHPTAALSGGGPVLVMAGGTLGGYGSVTGPVTNQGMIAAANALPAFASGPTGNFTINGSLTNGGLIDLAGAGLGNQLTVVGNYVGAGGTLQVHTFLGGDGSPSDKLVLSGGADPGSTGVKVINVGGPGAQTLSNGILVVQAVNGATTTAGDFALAGEARAGAYDYDLFRGSLDASAPNSWFLRSTFAVGPLPPEPPEPIDPVFPPYPPPEPLPPGVYPIIGPALATYGVVQPIARQLGVTTLGTLHDRIGDTLTNAAGPCAASSGNGIVRKGYETPPQPANCDVTGWFPSAWGRVFGQSVDNRYSAFADPSVSGQLFGFQAGLDVWRGSLVPGHSDTAGFYAAYANANVDVTGLVTNRAATAYVLQHTGTVNLDAVSGAAYWTHYGPSGWYLDAVAQATSYSGSAATQFTGLSPTGYGFIASLEGGYPVALPSLGPGFVLEPEGQVLWQAVKFDQTDDQFGYVALGSTYGGSGRLGLRAKWDVVADNGFVWQPYLRADFWDDWGGNATTDFRGDAVPLLEAGRRVELGGGLTTKVNANLSFFANADYQFAVSDTDGGKRDGFGGAAGLRYTW
jgi:outer membrane autotransporter protein